MKVFLCAISTMSAQAWHHNPLTPEEYKTLGMVPTLSYWEHFAKNIRIESILRVDTEEHKLKFQAWLVGDQLTLE